MGLRDKKGGGLGEGTLETSMKKRKVAFFICDFPFVNWLHYEFENRSVTFYTFSVFTENNSNSALEIRLLMKKFETKTIHTVYI